MFGSNAILYQSKKATIDELFTSKSVYLYFINWHFQWKRWNVCALMWTNRLSWMPSCVCARMCACSFQLISFWQQWAWRFHAAVTQSLESDKETQLNRKQKKKLLWFINYKWTTVCAEQPEHKVHRLVHFVLVCKFVSIFFSFVCRTVFCLKRQEFCEYVFEKVYCIKKWMKKICLIVPYWMNLCKHYVVIKVIFCK